MISNFHRYHETQITYYNIEQIFSELVFSGVYDTFSSVINLRSKKITYLLIEYTIARNWDHYYCSNNNYDFIPIVFILKIIFIIIILYITANSVQNRFSKQIGNLSFPDPIIHLRAPCVLYPNGCDKVLSPATDIGFKKIYILTCLDHF